MCLQPSFFEATILWNAYRVRPHYKNSLLWRRRELKTTTAAIGHSEFPKIKVLGNPWLDPVGLTKDLLQFCKNYKTISLPRILILESLFSSLDFFYDVHSFMIIVITCDRGLCPDDAEECRKNKSWLTGVSVLLILLKLHLFKIFKIAFYLDEWRILGGISSSPKEKNSYKLVTFYFPSPGIMVHKDKPALSKEKDELKFNPTVKAATLPVEGQICGRLIWHESQILVSIPPKSSQKQNQNRGRKFSSRKYTFQTKNILSIFYVRSYCFSRGLKENMKEKARPLDSCRC